MKKIIKYIAVVCLACTLLSACGKEAVNEETEVATNVTVYQVSASDINSEVNYTGEVKALEESDVEIADFAEKELASRNYDIFVVGPVDKLDRKKLEKYGEVHQVTPEQIFGH